MKTIFPKFQYMPGDRYWPVHEVQTIMAVPFVHLDDGMHLDLEGLNFDRNRDLYCINIFGGFIYKVDMKTKHVSHYYEFRQKRFKGTAIKPHKDGRFYVGGLDIDSDPLGEYGGILIVDPEKKTEEWLIKGYNVDDLVFDSNGGIYFTNYIGNPQNPEGYIGYLAPGSDKVQIAVPNLASPNGLCLSVDGEILWVTETNAGRLHRINLKKPRHNIVANYTTGFLGPDSCSIDEDDNVYVAMARQGRVLVFNPNGMLIGQVLIPLRDEGLLLGTTHPMVHPDRKELYITVHDTNGDQGANIFYCGSFAKGYDRAYQYL